jgi:hypothetical protein
MRVLTFEKLAYIAPGPPPPISATLISMTVTPLIVAGDSTPRCLLTDDDRRRMFEYYESYSGVLPFLPLAQKNFDDIIDEDE